MTVLDIKILLLVVYYIQKNAVIYIYLHSQHHSAIASIDQIKNLMISQKTRDQAFSPTWPNKKFEFANLGL